jgi:hypothetical protein
MPKKTVKRRTNIERPFNMGEWTSAMMFGTIRSALRKAFQYNWNPAKKALENARRQSQSKTNLRLKYEYKCACCGKYFERKLVNLDHKLECGSLKTWDDVAPFLQNLLPEDENAYQVLCIGTKEKPGCHLIKTKEYMDNKRKNEKL